MPGTISRTGSLVYLSHVPRNPLSKMSVCFITVLRFQDKFREFFSLTRGLDLQLNSKHAALLSELATGI